MCKLGGKLASTSCSLVEFETLNAHFFTRVFILSCVLNHYSKLASEVTTRWWFNFPTSSFNLQVTNIKKVLYLLKSKVQASNNLIIYMHEA